MQRTVVVGNDKNNVWFDHECREKRRSLRETLRKYNKSYNNYVEAADRRKEYSEEKKSTKMIRKRSPNIYKKNKIK